MRAILPLIASLGLGACLELDGVAYTIDLATHTGRLVLQGIGSDHDPASGEDPDTVEAEDLDELVGQYLEGDGLTASGTRWGILAWTVQGKRLVDVGERLDGEVDFSFADPADLGLFSYDHARPRAWCPPPGLIVTRANATARTRSGCLVWAAGIGTLRFEVAVPHAPKSWSLLERWRAGPGSD